MKRIFAIAAVAVVALTAAVSTAAARPMAGSLSGNVEWVAGWCCGDVWEVSGTGVIRGIGAVTFVADYTVGVDPYYTYLEGVGYVHPYLELRGLQLTITAANGDELRATGASTWSEADPAPPLEWHAVDGAGRFADLSGSGTYELAINGSSATLTLRGVFGG